ncbi:MAG: hypothetical protein ACTSSH_14030, partial [Candidatus Heimdallarchaeota archaeon]
IIWSATAGGNYFISIAPATTDIGNYTFTLLLSQQNDFNSGTDAGSTYNEPLLIEAGSSNGTMVDASDTSDFYSIYLENSQIIDIFMNTTSTTDINIFLFDTGGLEIASSTKLVGFNESIYYAISITGNYIIHVEFIESTISEIIVHYNFTISLITQNDGYSESGTDAGNTAEDAYFIIPLFDSIFKGRLVKNGDTSDFYYFIITVQSVFYAHLEMDAQVNFDITIYDSEKAVLVSSTEELPGASEYIFDQVLQNGTYYIEVKYLDEPTSPLEGKYSLGISLHKIPNTDNNQINWRDLFLKIIAYGVFPLFIIILIILILYMFTEVKIPLISKRLDKYLSKEGKAETVKSLKYALRIRDEQIGTIREEMIDKDSKRAKDLETLHRLEEDQKTKEKVQAISDDLANIIDSTIRRQLAKSSKASNKAKLSAITALLWLSEERLINYINSVQLLNERYILDKSKSFIITREHARETVRQAYWKRVGAMHLKKIKQVKVSSISEDTNIDIETVKEILRELVERKEIPAPIHMDRVSLLLSISDELIAELADVSQNTPIVSLKEISKSYDTTIESAKVIFEKITEEGYAKGEFISEDTFIVYELFTQMIIDYGSVKIAKLIADKKLSDDEERIKILIEKLIQSGDLDGQFLTDDMFLCFNNLTEQLKEMVKKNIDDIAKGDTRRVVFDIGSVVESIVKERLIMDIHEIDDVSELTKCQDVIESRELGRILRASEDIKITLPSNIELKSLNRFWAQKIKHTKPGELPYTPTMDEAQEFLFEANRALNRLLAQKIPTSWKRSIALKLIKK